jgi:hypothetical protein
MSRPNPASTLLLALGLAVAALTAGCISHRETVYRDEPRMKVEFENDTAGRLFYETLSKMPSSGRRSESETKVSLPIVFEHKQRVAGGENATFNDAVRHCDTNGDGRITEREARIFAGQHRAATHPSDGGYGAPRTIHWLVSNALGAI